MSRTLDLPCRYYRVYTDEDVPCREADFGFVERRLPLPAPQTALVLVDVWATHYIDSWFERAARITRERIVPLAQAFHAAGHAVLGLDSDPARVAALGRGENPLRYLADGRIEAMLADARFEATGDPERLVEAEVHVLCVPPPPDAERRPDLSHVEAAADAVGAALRPGSLVVLESTTWPGTTREVVLPRLEARSGLRLGADFALAYAPEREDPGHPERDTRSIPRLVGGLDDASARLAVALYSSALDRVVPVSSAEVAEAAKLFENTFRAVNIALVNELKLVLERLGIDVWEVLRAASTMPFGFMPFTPGPGMGGHCIPVDPFYIACAARRAGVDTRIV